MNSIFRIMFFLCLVLLIQKTSFSQDSLTKSPLITDKTSLGVGFGLDYSGFGVNLAFYPLRQLGLYGGIGSPNSAGIGYSVGMKIRPITKKHSSLFVPTLVGMYGYQSSVFVVNATEFNKIFNGFSVAFGADGFRRPGKHSYFSAYIVLPFRNDEVNNYMRELRQRGVQFKNSSLPEVMFSIAFRFILK